MYEIVIDTNVFVAALRSRKGKSFSLVEKIGEGGFQINVSVPIVLEYEEVLLRYRDEFGLSQQDIKDFLDYICKVSSHRKIHFLWRPRLRDASDDMVLELAVESEADYLVTFNKRDFPETKEFGIKLMTPGEFIQVLEGTR